MQNYIFIFNQDYLMHVKIKLEKYVFKTSQEDKIERNLNIFVGRKMI